MIPKTGSLKERELAVQTNQAKERILKSLKSGKKNRTLHLQTIESGLVIDYLGPRDDLGKIED